MSSPTSPPVGGTPPWTSPPSASRPKARLSRGLGVAIAAIVVIVLVVLALLLTGVIPGLKSSSSSGPSAPSYDVTFTESGLSSGTTWSVTLAGSTQSSSTDTITFTETNGTYDFTAVASGYTASPAAGSITVAGGAQSQAVAFKPLPAGAYTVTFSESGLPTGTSWSVTFNGTPGSSTTSSILFTIGNGSWPYTVGSVTGYTATPSSGNVKVSGVAATQAIAFASSGGGGGGGQTKFSQAYPVASASVGSGWVAILGVGVSVTSTYSNSSTPEWNSTCQLTGGPSSWPTLSAWTGTYANGYTTYWVFAFYKNISSVPTLEMVLVSGSTATSMGTLTGSTCVSSVWTYDTGLASGVIDSDQVANDIASNDSAYVSANPSATADYALVSGGSYSLYGYTFTVYPTWSVHFTTCPVNGGGTGSNFSAEVNATNGHVMSSDTSSGPCGAASYAPHSGGPPGLAPFASVPALSQLIRRS